MSTSFEESLKHAFSKFFFFSRKRGKTIVSGRNDTMQPFLFGYPRNKKRQKSFPLSLQQGGDMYLCINKFEWMNGW